MPNVREIKERIRSTGNISQVTHALQMISASKARKTQQSLAATTPYAQKTWELLVQLAAQPGNQYMNPLFTRPMQIINSLVIFIDSDQGLAGSYNETILKFTLEYFGIISGNVSYVALGKRGKLDLLSNQQKIHAAYQGFPIPPRFRDISSIGYLAVHEFLEGSFDHIFIAYTEFKSLLVYRPVCKQLLPIPVEIPISSGMSSRESELYAYEPEAKEILDSIAPRFISMQIYQAMLSAQASESASRMMAMHEASKNAEELKESLQLQYNQERQTKITNELLDISNGIQRPG